MVYLSPNAQQVHNTTMPRDFMGRVRDSLVVGVGGALYTFVDEPLKKFLEGVAPGAGAWVPQDPMDMGQAFFMSFTSSLLALTSYDLLVPKGVKKAIEMG